MAHFTHTGTAVLKIDGLLVEMLFTHTHTVWPKFGPQGTALAALGWNALQQHALASAFMMRLLQFEAPTAGLP
jgi:hypothetical protein